MAWLNLAAIALALALGYARARAIAWAIAGGALVLAAYALQPAPGAGTALAAAAWAAAAAVLCIRPLRRALVSDRLLEAFRRILPPMSQTEQEALEAGTVWWDGELFCGAPDWRRLLALPAPALSTEEQRFLDEECEALCALLDDWETTQLWQDLPPAAWKFVRERGFLGMIIPRDHGGKGFSALAHSAVVQKLSSRCSAAAVSVMVPNSLGPAELLLHYGTEEQKRHYLPRLARGLEIPCFALTNPSAGSDAASIPDHGVVCRGTHQGRELLGMRVTWDKRYITLGPIASLLGLAIRLYDPDRLLGGEQDLGITLVLVPADTPGVHIGRRHMPLNAVFQNGPNWGRDVFMPLEWIIGGPRMAGQGWRMLMECLAAGRSISLPSTSVGYTKLAARATGGYARVRRQFNLPIGRFEGVEEALARIGGGLYMMDAARVMTAGAVDLGEKPSVLSAIVKYHLTERGRAAVNDAMDVLAGKGICLGPGNFMGRAYQQLPIAITVEGANILTRSLIIFGQGAIRAHPFVLAEMRAAHDPDRARASLAFDAAFWAHLRFACSNALRALFTALTGSLIARAPAGAAPDTRRYYRHLTRFAAAFAFLADASMLLLGGSLKRRESLSARLGDALSFLYLASATLKRYEDEGRQREDLPLVHWALRDSLARLQSALDGVLVNFHATSVPLRLVAALLRLCIFPLGRWFAPPTDELGRAVAQVLITPCGARERLTHGMYLPRDEGEIVGAIEAALAIAGEAESAEAKLRGARRAGTLPPERPGALREAELEVAVAAGVLSPGEAGCLTRFARLRERIVRVDDFPADFGRAEALRSGGETAAA